MAITGQDTWRSDEQLLAMLDEPAEWIVNGIARKILATRVSLRDAITEARRLKSSQHVMAVARRSNSRVVMFYAQVDRLITLMG
jgi:hypothetical protein